MSKLKHKKFKSQRSNPTGLCSLKEIEISIGNSPMVININSANSILEKLRSPSAEDREIGAVIIAKLADKAEVVKHLISKKVVKVAAPLLLDKSVSVRHAVTSSLRSIAVSSDYSVSEAMVDQDIMTCLVSLLEEYKDPWSSVKNAEDKIDSKSEIFVEACELLWQLCEHSDTAVSVFNKKNLALILLQCLNVENYDLKIPIAVAQCLHTVSENNTSLKNILMQPQIQDQLRALMNLSNSTQGHILLKTLAAGIMTNMYGNNILECMSDVTQPVMHVVSSTLHEPISPMLDDLNSTVICQKAGRRDKSHEEGDLIAEINAVQNAAKNTKYVLSAKQAALEILGNVFEGGSDDECSSVSCSESSNEMEIEECNVGVSEFELGVSREIRELVKHNEIVEKVLELIFLQSETSEQVIEDDLQKDCLKSVNKVRCTALLALNNMIHRLKSEDLGGQAKLMELWLNLAKIVFNDRDVDNTEEVEAVTRCMHAILQKLAEESSSQFSNMTDADLEQLLKVYRQSKDPRIKVNIIGSLGIIGKILNEIKTQTSSSLIKTIGVFLIECCNKNSEVWVLAEAFDAIIDVFSDDDVITIARDINLAENLSRLKVSFDRKYKNQRRYLGDQASFVRTTKENLTKFIMYLNKCGS